MTWLSNDDRWGSLAKTFHWLMAILILSLGCVGLYMTDLENSPQKLKIFALHKSVGLTVLALALLRLSWRLRDPRPADVPMPRWQAAMAHGVHAGLYLLMLVLPLSGWLFNSAAGFPLQYFGLFNLPSLTGGKSDALRAVARAIHENGWWLLLAIVAVHAAGALKHHFLDRDETLLRMWPGRARRVPEPVPAPEPVVEPVVIVPIVSPDTPRQEP
jgi:cytochrome b561